MGLGKTVMTIALILSRPGRGCPANQRHDTKSADADEITKKIKKDCHTKPSSKANGSTLIVCPMALLGQWKVNILFPQTFFFLSKYPLLHVECC